jgi:hypothetical protein
MVIFVINISAIIFFMLFSSRIIWWLQKNNVSLQQKCYNRQFENKFSLCLFALSINQITKILLMGKIVDKTETKIVTLDGVEIIKQVTKVLMPNGKYRYPTVYFTVNDDVKALTTEQLDKIRIPVYKQLI